MHNEEDNKPTAEKVDKQTNGMNNFDSLLSALQGDGNTMVEQTGRQSAAMTIEPIEDVSTKLLRSNQNSNILSSSSSAAITKEEKDQTNDTDESEGTSNHRRFLSSSSISSQHEEQHTNDTPLEPGTQLSNNTGQVITTTPRLAYSPHSFNMTMSAIAAYIIGVFTSLLSTVYPMAMHNFTSVQLIDAVVLYLERHISSFHSEKSCNLPSSNDLRSVFYSIVEPSVSLKFYVNRHVMYGKYEPKDFLLAMIYIDRLAKKDVALIPSHRNVHRLLSGALAIAVETHGTIDEEHFIKVAGISTTAELRKIKDTLLQFLNFDTIVNVREMQLTFQMLDSMKQSNLDNTMSTITCVTPNTFSHSETRNSDDQMQMRSNNTEGRKPPPPPPPPPPPTPPPQS